MRTALRIGIVLVDWTNLEGDVSRIGGPSVKNVRNKDVVS